MHSAHIRTHYFSKIHLNIILPSTSLCPMRSLPFRFSDRNFVCFSYLPHVPTTSYFLSRSTYLVKCTNYEAFHIIFFARFYSQTSFSKAWSQMPPFGVLFLGLQSKFHARQNYIYDYMSLGSVVSNAFLTSYNNLIVSVITKLII
jgi:hypothetical protein